MQLTVNNLRYILKPVKDKIIERKNEMKKIIKTFIIGALMFVTFVIGRETASETIVTETVTETEYVYCDEMYDFLDQIVDFNTDGTELSIMLRDNTEVYAYREDDVDEYKERRVVKVENGIAYLKNGSSYKIKN